MGNFLVKHNLRKKTFDSLQYLELTKLKIYDAKVISIYDGDTCHIAVKHNGKFYKINVRINGIDTPEMRPKNVSSIETKDDIKRKAIEARNFLMNLITDQEIIIHDDISKQELQKLIDNNKKIIKFKYIKQEKYGRALGDLFVDNKNVSHIMIDNGYAKEYHGGTKTYL